MLDLYLELDAVLTIFEQHKINYALCGGLAVSVYAKPRMTQDIDILVDAVHCEPCKELLSPSGFKFFAIPMRVNNNSVEIHKLTKIDSNSGDYLFLDLVIPISLEARMILEQKIRIKWQDKKVWIVSREGLLSLKKLSNRPKDLLDIENLSGALE